MTTDAALDQKHPVERLTQRQRDCLRLVPMRSKEIARELGLEWQTVNDYISDALKRLGVNDRRRASKLLSEYEAAVPQQLGHETQRLAALAKSANLEGQYQLSNADQQPGQVREVQALYHADMGTSGTRQTVRGPQDGTSALRTVFLVIAIAAGIVILASAAKPLAEGFEALGALIREYRQSIGLTP